MLSGHPLRYAFSQSSVPSLFPFLSPSVGCAMGRVLLCRVVLPQEAARRFFVGIALGASLGDWPAPQCCSFRLIRLPSFLPGAVHFFAGLVCDGRLHKRWGLGSLLATTREPDSAGWSAGGVQHSSRARRPEESPSFPEGNASSRQSFMPACTPLPFLDSHFRSLRHVGGGGDI